MYEDEVPFRIAYQLGYVGEEVDPDTMDEALAFFWGAPKEAARDWLARSKHERFIVIAIPDADA